MNHDIHEARMKRMSKTSIRLQENDSLNVLIHENDPIRDEYIRTDDETNLPLAEIMPMSVPQNSSLVRIK